MTVRLDTDTPPLKGLAVKGTLIGYDAGPISITSDFIAVEGRLEIGTHEDPFANTAVITLTGADGTETPYSAAIGNRALGVVGNGELSLHGESRSKGSWTQIASDIQPGDTTFTATSFVDWEPGDRIVIAPSGFDPLEAEEVEVVSKTGNVVTFDPPAEFLHYGRTQTYEGKTIDMRAEVGLLSRNIRIQGAEDSEFFRRNDETEFPAGFGAHSIFRDDSDIRIDGVEFTRTGQSGKPGRYAAHWHLAGDQSGDYIRNTSTHHSFQRAIVMHQSDFITAEDNVAYFVGNHAFIPGEDGNEDGNVWRRNLSVLSYSPLEQHFAFLEADQPDNSSQGEFRSSGFWMRSTNHVFEDNVSAGAYEGQGFFFDRVAAIRNTAQSPMVFSGNRAHSTHRLDTGYTNFLTYKEITKGHALFVGENSSPDELVFEDFQAYSSFAGLWLEDRRVTVRDSILSDNAVGAFLMKSRLDDTVIVGESDVEFDIPLFGSPEYFRDNWSAGVHIPPSHGQNRAPVINDVSVVNQKDAALIYNREEMFPGTLIEKLKVVNTPVRAKITEQIEQLWYLSPHYGAFDDPNGQFLDDGVARRWVRTRSPIATDDCLYDLDVQAYGCDPEDSLMVQFWAVDGANAPTRMTDLTDGFTFQMEDFNSFAWVQHSRPYFVQWYNGQDPRGAISGTISDTDGKSAYLQFAVSGAPTSITQNGTSVSLGNRAAFERSSGPAAFHDAAAGLLHVKFRGNDELDFDISAPFQIAHPTARLRPSESVDQTQSGLTYQVRNGAANDVPRIQPGQLGAVVSRGTTSGIDTSVWNGAAGSSVVFNGYIDAPESGYYRFAHNTRGYAQVEIGGTWIAGRLQDTLSSDDRGAGGDMFLEAGLHPVQIILSHDAQTQREPGFEMFWRLPSSNAFSINDLPEIPASAFRRAP